MRLVKYIPKDINFLVYAKSIWTSFRVPRLISFVEGINRWLLEILYLLELDLKTSQSNSIFWIKGN